MACTRFNYDECRTKKKLQQQTGPGRWVLNVPGNGNNPYYIEDPHIRIQKWGGNLMTNTINLESSLLGINKPISKDCLAKDDYKNFTVNSSPKFYPSTSSLYTEQSRSIMPAWTVRNSERTNIQHLFFNPQENVFLPFNNNVSTRVLEKDNYSIKRENKINEFINNIHV